MEDLLKKKIFVCSHFAFQNDPLMTEGWGLYKNMVETVVILVGVFNMLIQNHLSGIFGKKKTKYMCLALYFNSEMLFSGR